MKQTRPFTIISHHIEGCMRRDRRSQEYIYKRFAPEMLGICRRYTRTTGEAEDVLQLAFVKLFNSIQSYSASGSFEGWLKRIVTNTALDAWRKERKMSIIVSDELADYGWCSPIEEKIEDDFLLSCVNRLPANYRVAFNLHVVEGYSHREIAGRLGISEELSKIHVSRARKKLRVSLERACRPHTIAC